MKARFLRLEHEHWLAKLQFVLHWQLVNNKLQSIENREHPLSYLRLLPSEIPEVMLMVKLQSKSRVLSYPKKMT
jgi:hypothetical protein